jgi:hypothetical protein
VSAAALLVAPRVPSKRRPRRATKTSSDTLNKTFTPRRKKPLSSSSPKETPVPKVSSDAHAVPVVRGPWKSPALLDAPCAFDPRLEDLPPLRTLCVDAPNRPPDWRWHRAAHFVVSGMRVPRHADNEGLGPIVTFQRTLRRCRTERGFQSLLDRMPALFRAHEIYADSPKLFRAGLEARLLADEPFASIARRTALDVPTIEVYERVFFNVLDRLDASDFIANRCIGKNLNKALSEDDFGSLMRAYGYHCGAAVVDELVTTFAGDIQRPETPAEVSACFDRDICRTLLRKTALAARMLRVDDTRTAIKLLQVWTRIKEIQARHEEFDNEYAKLTQGIEVVCANIGEVFFGEHPPGFGPAGVEVGVMSPRESEVVGG